MTKKPIRFAELIRVSTERQQERGESLRTQEQQIKQAVEGHGGMITKTYAGQEHATAGWEREQLNALLSDAQKQRKPFDAVIVCDASRWSRDNVCNDTGLDILRDNGIRFFVLGMEFDLFEPMHRFMLTQQATMNQLQANLQKQKSALNRIHRAKRGLPTAGKLPFGRRFNKETGKWTVDSEKRAMVKDCAKRYLAGESIVTLADEYGVNHTNLHKILMRRCGADWEQTFTIPDLNINETITIKVPPLLPEKLIRALRKKAAANKTYQHGHIKYPYLLSRMIFCDECGYAMFGQTNHSTARYYRHAHARRERPCEGPKCWLRADDVESAVIEALFEMFGNPAGVQRAIEHAMPNKQETDRQQKRLNRIECEMTKVSASRKRIIKRLGDNDDDAVAVLEELSERKESLVAERERLLHQLENVPDAGTLEAVAEDISNRLRKSTAYRKAYLRHANSLDSMTWDDKRTLLEQVFGGLLPDGRRMGVYVRWHAENGSKPSWSIGLQGFLCDEHDFGAIGETRRPSHLQESIHR